MTLNKLLIVLGLVVATLSAGCATRRGASSGRGGGSGGVVDGVKWKDPGRGGTVRNAFNTFRM